LKKDREEREKLKKLKEQDMMNNQKKSQPLNNEFVNKILSDTAPLTNSKIDELFHGGEN